MKHIFNLDNPLFQLLSRVADLILVNLTFLVCCIPVFTIGPALCAMNQITQDMVFNNEGKLFARFWSAFKSNFGQGTAAGLIAIGVYAGLICDFVLTMAYFKGIAATIMYALLAALLFIVTGILGYLFPLIIRYDNTLKEHLYNALILSVTNFPKTILIVLLLLFLPILAIISPMVFIQTLIFWVFLGFGFVAFVISMLLRPVFRKIEENK